MSGPAEPARDVLSFGPFRLVASERLLTRQDVVVPLAARAFDILIALVSRPNQAIGKAELMAEVWPDVTVGESSLRFHVASLRRALGDGKDGARYISTLAGRGYCFVAAVSRASMSPTSGHEGVQSDVAPPGVATYQCANVPNPLPRMVGRAEGVAAVSSQLAATRFVTIVGAGGVGKTTVAVAVGHDLIEAFAGAVHFVDLGTLSDPALVATSLAAMLGLSGRSHDSAASLITHLRDKRMLLILDNCEHLIEATAILAARLFDAAPQIYILATSREALRVQGEHVYRLAPLTCPPDDPALTATVALTFSATQLFVERAMAHGADLTLSDTDAAIVAGICRKLDGVALAIELAAGRVEAYGLQQTATLLDERLSLLWLGQRTAPPRQQTLKATLDWSYGLLSGLERQVLGQLAVFIGDFTLEAALAVVTSPGIDQSLVLSAIDSLVAKSMVATRPVGAMMRYRLLDTTRTYALDAGIDDTELAARHAIYYRRWLEQTGAEWPTLSNAAERAPHLAALGNVRAALEWCFGSNGDAGIGVGLASAAAPVFLAMSLLTECHRWSERALLALDDAMRAGTDEMQLQTAFALSLMFTRGNSEDARAALARSLTIAEDRGDGANQLQLIGRLHLFHHRLGDFTTGLHYAELGAAVASRLKDPPASAFAHSLLGISLSYTGDFGRSRSELEAALRQGPGAQRTSTLFHGFDHYSFCGAYLARTLWLQGHPDQALKRARQTIDDVAGMDHPVTLAVALTMAVSVFLGTGDLDAAQEHTEWLIAHGDSHSLRPSVAAGRGFKGELAILQGKAKDGVEGLQSCLEELHASRYGLLTTAFRISLAQGFAALGRFAEGIDLIDKTINRVQVNGELSYMSETLRVKGSILLQMPLPRVDDAETCFIQSLEWSRRQGARSWELRAAIDLATLSIARERPKDARALLQPLLDQFLEGRKTADLKAAEHILSSVV